MLVRYRWVKRLVPKVSNPDWSIDGIVTYRDGTHLSLRFGALPPTHQWTTHRKALRLSPFHPCLCPCRPFPWASPRTWYCGRGRTVPTALTRRACRMEYQTGLSSTRSSPLRRTKRTLGGYGCLLLAETELWASAGLALSLWSKWAEGLLDDPPPGYTPTETIREMCWYSLWVSPAGWRCL